MGLLDRIFRRAADEPPRSAGPGHAPDMTPEEVGKAVQLGFDGKRMEPAELPGGGWPEGSTRDATWASGSEWAAYGGGADSGETGGGGESQ